jgi:membrane peptidoglycan carboxypeptidase
LVLLVAFGVVAALLVAGLALPAVVGVGLATRNAAEAAATMPDALRLTQPAQPSVLYAADGKTKIATFYAQYRHDVTIQQIAPVMRQAMVAAEDRRFYQHGAVDAVGVLRAAAADLAGGGADQGASTLTMQYVRNVLKNDPTSTAAQRLTATEDTLARKLRETQYAAEVEHQLSKDEILTRYLNIVYFGAGAYGIDAAAWRYFSVPPSRLRLPQAALIAGLVQAPDTDSPIDHDPTQALARRRYVLASMRGMGVITAAQQAAANAAPLGLRPRAQPTQGCSGVPAGHNDWGFFCDYFVQWWDGQAAFGGTPASREAALRTGGYQIVSTLDPAVQASALAESVGVYGYEDARALPIAVVQPGTGKVLAMAVNRHHGLSGGSSTVAPLISGGGSAPGYPTGSTFKLFTMLAALQAGMPLNSQFDAPARIPTRWPDSGPNACDGQYCPGNENPPWMGGPRTMWTGFGRSVNTYFVHLEEQVGADKAVAMARALGITFRAPSDAAEAGHAADWGAFTLGVADTTPLDLAEAYATLGAGGVTCSPLPVSSVTDSAGRPAAGAADPRCHRAVAAGIAAAAADAARCPVGQQSAYGQCDGGTAEPVSGIVGRPVAGKTGSTQGNVTETFVGVTPQAAAAGIAADPDDPSDAVGSAISASVNAAVAHVLATALTGLPVLDFPTPPASIAFGTDGAGDLPG